METHKKSTGDKISPRSWKVKPLTFNEKITVQFRSGTP